MSDTVIIVPNKIDRPLLPAGPWSIIITALPTEHPGAGHVYIADANGKKIMSIWASAAQKMEIADFIVTAREKETP